MLLKPDRNEPCLCGSGRKFKNCCQREFEETRLRLGRDLRARLPEAEIPASFVEVLAAACAIAGDDEEIALPIERAIDSAVRVVGVFGDEMPSSDRLLGLQRLLDQALRENPVLATTRHDPRRFSRIMNELSPTLESTDSEPISAEDQDDDDTYTLEAMRRIYHPALTEDYTLAVYWALRTEPDEAELDGIIWGLVGLTTRGMAHNNAFMTAVFNLTFEELAAAEEEMRTLKVAADLPAGGLSEEEEDEAQWEFESFLRRHPLMAKALSDDAFDAMAEALKAVARGDVALHPPAWVAIGGLSHLAAHAPEYLRPEPVKPGDRESRDHALLLGLDLREVGLEYDWEVFVPAVQSALSRAASLPKVSRKMKASLEELVEQLGSDLLEANRLAFQICYMEVISQLVLEDPMPTGLPPGNAFRLVFEDLVSRSRMEAYAEALRESGLEEAADHVLAVAEGLQ